MSTTTPLPTEPLRALRAAQVRWGRGFWHDVQERTFETTVPQMWASLSDPAVSPGLRNFRIAAGPLTLAITDLMTLSSYFTIAHFSLG